MSFFGGPASVRGFGQTVPPGDDSSASPAVMLPDGGSATAVSAIDLGGALAQYGPAVIFGGKPPTSPDAPIPPSGPLQVSTKGKRSVTSTASAKRLGPGPLLATSVRSTCTASRSGNKASVTVTGGHLVTAIDTDGNPTSIAPIPSHPGPNLTLTGITIGGDSFKVVFNEQDVAADGTITVNAVHMYLLGPTAVGELVVAQAFARV